MWDPCRPWNITCPMDRRAFTETKVGLFKDYLKTWLKLKTEASGWPSDVNTEAEKKRYIAEFLGKRGYKGGVWED